MNHLDVLIQKINEYFDAQKKFSDALQGVIKTNKTIKELQLCHEQLTEKSYSILHHLHQHQMHLRNGSIYDPKDSFTDQELINLLNETKI